MRKLVRSHSPEPTSRAAITATMPSNRCPLVASSFLCYADDAGNNRHGKILNVANANVFHHQIKGGINTGADFGYVAKVLSKMSRWC